MATEETKPVERGPIKPDLFWACEYPACACECGHIAGKCEYCHWVGAVFCRCPFVCESTGRLRAGDICPVHGTANLEALKGSRKHNKTIGELAKELAPAADAGPRQPMGTCCWNCGAYSTRLPCGCPCDCSCGFCEHCRTHKSAPPVPQEAASMTIPSSNDDPAITQAVRKVVEDYGGTLQMLGNSGQAATAPDEAMRVAEQIITDFGRATPSTSEQFKRHVREVDVLIRRAWLALIREAGSERERRLETALRNLRDRLQIIMAWPDEHWSKHLPIEIESELAEASRLLGGEL